MTLIADHLVALVLHLADQQESNKLTFFSGDLPALLEENFGLTVPPSLAEQTCSRLTMLGGCNKLHSPLTGDIYQLDRTQALWFFDPNNGPTRDTSTDYDEQYESMNKEFSIVKTYYHGGSQWLDRAIQALKEQDLYAIESGASTVAPASDRIVTINHNSVEILDISEKLEDLGEKIRSSNSPAIQDASEKGRLYEQIMAARNLLKVDRVSLRAISGLLLTSLTYLAMKFADEAIGEAAAHLLQLLRSFFGNAF